jgi:hypothetical protein
MVETVAPQKHYIQEQMTWENVMWQQMPTIWGQASFRAVNYSTMRPLLHYFLSCALFTVRHHEAHIQMAGRYLTLSCKSSCTEKCDFHYQSVYMIVYAKVVIFYFIQEL